MRFFKLFIILFISSLSLNSCLQEKMLFHPEKLPENYEFKFDNTFHELSFPVSKKVNINGLLFKADTSKGLVFYLHGNAGSLRTWGHISDVYLDNNYDFFILDYRGFGKSGGKIKSEKQLYRDNQLVYDSLKTMYKEKDIVIIGYSIGTGFAAKLAADNQAKQLILKTPYYSMVDLAKTYVNVPKFIIRYDLKTNERIPEIKCPIAIFHGDADEVIYTNSSKRLYELCKEGDQLFILKGQKHNGINNNMEYKKILKTIL